MNAGDTFILPKTSAEVEHLWVIVTEPDAKQMAVCVNITSKHTYSDTTLTLKPGDHPFITKDSVVHYPDARILNVGLVENALGKNIKGFVCKPSASCAADLLKRIQDGVLKSPHCPKEIKALCQAHWAGTARQQ